jgi:hypothetical protein
MQNFYLFRFLHEAQILNILELFCGNYIIIYYICGLLYIIYVDPSDIICGFYELIA